jgi:flagellar basal body-associated protein FliL
MFVLIFIIILGAGIAIALTALKLQIEKRHKAEKKTKKVISQNYYKN